MFTKSKWVVWFSKTVKMLTLMIVVMQITEAVARRYTVKNVFLKILQNSYENNCVVVLFLIMRPEACNFVKKETATKVFSCEFC